MRGEEFDVAGRVGDDMEGVEVVDVEAWRRQETAVERRRRGVRVDACTKVVRRRAGEVWRSIVNC